MQSGSGYGAFNILLPTEQADLVSLSNTRRAESQLAQATLGDRVEASQLALAGARRDNRLKDRATDHALLADAAALATTAEEWDGAMKALAEQGVAEAGQFVGRYSPRLQRSIASAYSAADPVSALTAMGGEGVPSLSAPEQGRGGRLQQASPLTGAGDMRAVFYGKSPKELQAIFQNLTQAQQAINAVKESPNPAATWDQSVQAMGRPDLVGQYSPQKLAAAEADVTPYLQYLGAQMQRQQMGIPETQPPVDIQAMGGGIYAIDRANPRKPSVEQLVKPERANVFVGTDEDGRAVFADPETGAEVRGETSLKPKPTAAAGGRGGAAGSVFEAKRQAWLEAHPGDIQGALEYAGSLKGKELSGDQAMKAAASQAERDLNARVMAGNPPADVETFLKEETAKYYRDFTVAAPAAPEGAPVGTVTLGRIKGMTPAQAEAVQGLPGFKQGKLKGAGGKSRDNPVVPTSEAQYNALARGTWYVHPSGRIVQKK